MRTLCVRCGDTPMPGWPLCAKCVIKAAAEANDGAKCSDPLVYERVGGSCLAPSRTERSLMVQTVYKSLTAGLLVLMLILALAGGIPQPDTSEAPAPVAAAVDAVIGEPGIAEAHSGHICGPRYAIHFTWRARAYERVVGYGSSFFGHWAVIENWEYAQHLGRFVRVDRFHRSGCRMVMR